LIASLINIIIFIPTDWTGSLAPGEIFFQSNKLPPDPETGAERTVLLGDLLVGVVVEPFFDQY
jgi:hypothetical protein